MGAESAEEERRGPEAASASLDSGVSQDRGLKPTFSRLPGDC